MPAGSNIRIKAAELFNSGNSQTTNLKDERPEILSAFFAKQEKTGNCKITFKPIKRGKVGGEVYLVVKTKNFRGKKIQIDIHQGKEEVVGEQDKLIEILQDGEVKLIEAEVGAYDDDGGEIANPKYFEDLAIAKVTLRPKSQEDFEKWNEDINAKDNKKTFLYLLIDATKLNDGYEDGSVAYHGNINDEANSAHGEVTNYWLDADDKWFELLPNCDPPWMEIAWEEHKKWSDGNWIESDNADGTQTAQAYINKAGDNFAPTADAWCGCFAHWVLEETNTQKSKNYSTVAEYPPGSLNYYHKVRYPNSVQIKPSMDFPAYGLITVLRRGTKWSGHVGFMVNFVKKNNKHYAFLLGGNQNDKVCVQEFEVYKSGKDIKFKTSTGTVYILQGYAYPKEHTLISSINKADDYKKTGYKVEKAISTI